jgi:hypothetical protein
LMPELQQQQQQQEDLNNPARFGLGGLSLDGVWNFAYGANMSPRKLGGSRGLHPLESVPAVLKGYRPTFNHRWAATGVCVLCCCSLHIEHLSTAAAAIAPPAYKHACD